MSNHLERFHAASQKLTRRKIGVYRPKQSFQTLPYTHIAYEVACDLCSSGIAEWVKNKKAIRLKKLSIELRGPSGKPDEKLILNLLDHKRENEIREICKAWMLSTVTEANYSQARIKACQ